MDNWLTKYKHIRDANISPNAKSAHFTAPHDLVGTALSQPPPSSTAEAWQLMLFPIILFPYCWHGSGSLS